MNEPTQPQPPEGGSKLSTIFLIVLGLHIVLIVAFSAYYLLKGDTSVESDTPVVAEAPTAPEPGHLPPAQPVLETAQDATPALPATPAEPAETAVLPMPPSNDPIWTRVPEPAPRPVAAAPSAPAPAPRPATTPAPAAGTHTVAKGDTLARIARTHGISVADLKAANQLTSDMIRIGQVLTLPATRATTTAQAPAPAAVPVAVPVTTTATPAAPAGSYTVAKGDTLWGIARKLGVNPQELAKANGIQDPSKLKPGMVLRLPGSTERQEMANPAPARPAPAPVPTDMAMAPGQG